MESVGFGPRLALATAVGAALLAAGPAAALVVDGFDATQSLSVDSGTPVDSGTVSDGSILGSEREASLSFLAGPASGSLQVNPSSNSQLIFGLDPQTTASGLLLWDGIGAAGLGGVDLTDGGLQLGFGVRVDFDDLPIDLVFTVGSVGGTSEGTLSLPGGIIVGPVDFLLPFASFLPTSGLGADFTSADLVSLSIENATAGTDLQIDLIETIPEPGTAALFALGLAGLAAGSRRRPRR